MIIIGILGGLAAALLQTLSYVASRSYLARGGRSTTLWVRSQLWMGLAAIPLCLALYQEPTKGWLALGLPLATCVGGYLFAQWCMLTVVRGVAASRLAPLLGLKIPILALFALILGQTTIGPWRWAAVGLAVAAAVAIQFSGIRLRPWQLIMVLLTVTGYAVSDVSIAEMQFAISDQLSLRMILFILGLIYVTCALILTPAVGLLNRNDPLPWQACLPYAACWLGAMAGLNIAIGLVGVVPAIMLQALRAPLSVIIGQIIARRGHHHLEQPIDWQTMVRQLIAALLMVGATALWVLTQ